MVIDSASERKTLMQIRVISAVVVAFLLSGCSASSPNSSESEAQRSPSPVGSLEVNKANGSSKSEGYFKISVMNYDDSSFPEFEIWIRGQGSWVPDLTYGGDDLSNVGPFPLGETQESGLFVYPYGRNGTELSIPFTLPLGYISNSDRGMLLVYVEDGFLYLVGEMIQDTELKFKLS